MRKSAGVLALLIASGANAQSAPVSRENAQQMIFAALDDATYTIQNSNPAATGWYKGQASDPCLTRYQLFKPPHVVGGIAQPSKTYSFGVNWTEVRAVGPEPSNPKRIRVIRNSATEWFFLPVDRHAGFIAAGRYLIRACNPGSTAASPPVRTQPRPKPQPQSQAQLPSAPPSGVVIANFLSTRELPRHWTVSYAGLKNQVHVFTYTADLRANPMSQMLSGSVYLSRDVCKDPMLKAILQRQMRMSADTVYIDAGGTRTVRGSELRCS